MSEQKHYWMAKSGKYAGVRMNDAFWNYDGAHVGMFSGDLLHSAKDGRVIAKIVCDEYLGKYSSGARLGTTRYARMGRYAMANRLGVAVGMDDPELGE